MDITLTQSDPQSEITTDTVIITDFGVEGEDWNYTTNYEY